jgi:soluble lytic murein transglycosylase-like protein
MLQTQNPYSRERIDALTTMLAGMDARGRQAYAAQHRNDPAVVATAVHVNNIVKAAERSKAMQAGGPMPTVVDQNIAAMTPPPAPVAQTQLPEDQGIARIPAPNMQAMADGGIAGYGDGDDVPRQNGMAQGGMYDFAQRSEPVVRMSGGGMAPYIPGYRDTGKVVDYRQAIVDEAQLQGVPAAVALQISGVESNFNPKAKPIDPKTGKPRSSATSFFQVIDETFKGLGGDPKKRNDPMENIRVGVKYLAQNQAALTKQLGRPPKPQELYATHFLGTETGSKLLSADPSTPVGAFLDKADPKNKEKILTANPEVLGGKKTVGDVLAWTQKKMAPVLTSAIPIGSAQAETPPKAGITDLVSQIPGSKVAPRAPDEKDRYITGNQGVIGAGETALQYLTGTLAIPTAGGAAALEQVPNMLSGIFGSGKGIDRAEMEKSFRDKAAQVTYEPRTVGGRTVSESTAKTLEDLKVPSY